MKEYYGKRAQEYEQVYLRDDPFRQLELTQMTHKMQQLFKARDVLEVACGTGYWTERIGPAVHSVTGIDITEETLDIARSKGIENATILTGDAYQLNDVPGQFNAGLANFWFSHVPKSEIDVFLDSFHARLGSGAVVFMADNQNISGLGGTLIHKFGDSNTYKLRELNDGTKYEIVKNYYDEAELRAIFEPKVNELKIHMGQCFWWVHYIVR